jgi:hypothetical protein
MHHLFQTYMFHMRCACEACRFGIIPFLDSLGETDIAYI